jgi:hypothetical protein
MKKLVALVAAGMFAASFAAQAEGSCSGSTYTASTPVPTTIVLDTVTKPVATTKTGG